MVRNDRRNCTEGRVRYSSRFSERALGKIEAVEEFHSLGGVPRLSPFSASSRTGLAEISQRLPLQPDPDTKPHLERDESCLPDTCSARLEVHFEAPSGFHVCLLRQPEKMC